MSNIVKFNCSLVFRQRIEGGIYNFDIIGVRDDCRSFLVGYVLVKNYGKEGNEFSWHYSINGIMNISKESIEKLRKEASQEARNIEENFFKLQ